MAYEFDGEEYRRASSHQKEWGSRLVQELDLQGDERILDLGCGDGVLTAQLALRVPRGSVLGIDASEGMIATARAHTSENLRFALKDINTLDYDGAFDLIFSNATLHWIEDHEGLLRQAHRALRNGGIIRFNFAADGNCAHFFAVVKNAMMLPPYRSDFKDFDWPWFMPTLEEYEALVHRSEFKDVRVWLENADRFFPDAQAMIRWVDQPSLVPFLMHVGEPHKQAFRNFVVEQMLRETLQADGRCFETFRRINVFARKHG
ncbi:MAG: methyltransferase type 11 [Planctomycetes bacterium RBG_13_62_9]|nr:MAG: methyltransferase type 11 [Planctomycetes bacterium RBG_13_62_9]